ncbi:MAG: hypothetical protein ACE5JR_09855 [Gemmatimonadota bacterium]
MPAKAYVAADPDVKDCLCDPCAEMVDSLKRSKIAERLAAEMGRLESQ